MRCVFQPYGPAELAYIEALASELALDVLLDPPRVSIHRMWVANRGFIERSKGSLNPEWVGDSPRRPRWWLPGRGALGEP
jgi:hypothetical protein